MFFHWTEIILELDLNKNLDFSPEDRTENIRRTAEVANLFTKAGFIVLVSLISPYRSERKKARDIRPEIFREIYIEASLVECSKRDVKGLYAKAIKVKLKTLQAYPHHTNHQKCQILSLIHLNAQ